MKSATINYWLYLLSANANSLIYHLNPKKIQWLIYLSSSLIDKECNNLDLENVP
jgi:hypothetical protein